MTEEEYHIKIRLPRDMEPVLKDAAEAEDRSINNWITRALKIVLIQKGYRNRLSKGI